MKKFLAIFLTVCMLFSVTALAAETTFVDPFTLLDFGSESRLDDMWKANLLAGIEKYNCVVEENDDSWTLTAINTDQYVGGLSNSHKVVSGFQIKSISQITFGSLKINNGWGTYLPKAYSQANGWVYDETTEWQGKNQFMKIRLKNMTDNTVVSFMSSASENFGGDWVLIFDIEANDTEFKTYIVDCAVAAGRGFFFGKRDGSIAAVVPGAHQFSNLVPWVGTGNNIPNTDVLVFNLFGALRQGSPDNTSQNIKEGATVEVDYIIFAATPDLAAEYKSIDEGYVPEETTTTEKVETTTTESVVETTTTESVVETTTTESVVETTTTEKVETTTTESVETTTTESVVETTTTESVVETTTTESVVETTTTEAVVDQTTAPQDNSTTTTEQNTDDENDGGFPVWIIIVIVVVIGGGVAAIFVFKKK